MKEIMRIASLLSILVACQIVSAEATYQLTFDSPWSSTSHPGAYPGGAHFSPLIGGTHHGGVSYWNEGELASAAIEQMAETGGTTLLRNLVLGDINMGTAADVVTAGGINAPGSRTTSFVVSAQHPLLTLVTMIAPSPDWFLGVSGLDFRTGGRWADSISITLENYDAGTDSGIDFTSANFDTIPQEPISVLGTPLAGLPPIGTFTFSLMSSTALCDFDADGTCGLADLDQMLGVGPLANAISVDYGINHHFDINGDGFIDLADRDDWLAGAAVENGLGAPYLPADANLDGTVDGSDFIRWNSHKFTASLAAERRRL